MNILIQVLTRFHVQIQTNIIQMLLVVMVVKEQGMDIILELLVLILKQDKNLKVYMLTSQKVNLIVGKLAIL